MQAFSSGIIGLMLFARIWGGLGAGGLTVVAPLYLTEIAPAKSRGMVVSIYMVVLLSFLTIGKHYLPCGWCTNTDESGIGFFINYAVNATMPVGSTQYRIVQIVPLIPTGFAFACSFFLTDTPRWLASQDRGEEALAALCRLRGHASGKNEHTVSEEYEDIQQQIRMRQQTLADVSTWTIVKEIATSSTYRKRFLLGAMMQTVAQWSGGNGITYYIPEVRGLFCYFYADGD
jgi:MFS family permease